MACAFVQGDGNQTTISGSSVAVVAPSSLTAGSTVIVGARSDGGVHDVFTVADTLGNTYSVVKTILNGIDLEVFRAVNVIGGATTITATSSGGFHNLGIDFVEVSGADTTESIGQSASNTGSDTTPTVSLTLAGLEDFAISFVADNGLATLSAQSLSAGSGWTASFRANGDGFSRISVGSEYKQGVTGLQTGDWSDTPSVDWAVVMVSLVATPPDLFAQACL